MKRAARWYSQRGVCTRALVHYARPSFTFFPLSRHSCERRLDVVAYADVEKSEREQEKREARAVRVDAAHVHAVGTSIPRRAPFPDLLGRRRRRRRLYRRSNTTGRLADPAPRATSTSFSRWTLLLLCFAFYISEHCGLYSSIWRVRFLHDWHFQHFALILNC